MKLNYCYTKTLDLHFFRHGQSIYQCQRLISGLNEQGLSGLGKIQTHKVARHIKDIDFDCVISSDLRRAIETWRIVSNYFGDKIPPKNVMYSHLLREKNQGVQQMQSIHVLKDQDSDRLHKFAGGESWEDVKLRVEIVIQYMVQHFIGDFQEINKTIEGHDDYKVLQTQFPTIQEKKRHHSVLIVTHYGFIREFFNVFQQMHNKYDFDTKYSYYAQNASMFQVRFQLNDLTGWRTQIIAMNSKEQQFRPFYDDDL